MGFNRSRREIRAEEHYLTSVLGDSDTIRRCELSRRRALSDAFRLVGRAHRGESLLELDYGLILTLQGRDETGFGIAGVIMKDSVEKASWDVHWDPVTKKRFLRGPRLK